MGEKGSVALDEREWRTVVADPPWRPEMSVVNGGAPKASPQHHYDTMSLDEIKALRPRLAKQAHLYIWCLTPHVDWGFEVCRAWGGQPITLLTWRKPGLGAGRFRCNTEHVVVGRVGPRAGNPFGQGGRYAQATEGTVFDWPRGSHSEKPHELYALAERLSPAPRLDMYARRPRPGWAVFGDQIEADLFPSSSTIPPREKTDDE
jgi:N6-adenosine-specific RNA methylase IME4